MLSGTLIAFALFAGLLCFHLLSIGIALEAFTDPLKGL